MKKTGAGSIEEMRHEQDGGNHNSTVKQEGDTELHAANPGMHESEEVEAVTGPEDVNDSSDDETAEHPSWEGNTPVETAKVAEMQIWAGMRRGEAGDSKGGRETSLAACRKNKITLGGADSEVRCKKNSLTAAALMRGLTHSNCKLRTGLGADAGDRDE
jgi:hypothetical protein